MGILDIVLIVFLLVTVILGLKKGFAKMISGPLCVIVALGGSIALAFVLTGIVQGIELFGQLQTATAGWFTQPIMTLEVASQEALAEALASEDAGIFSVLAGLATQIFDGMQQAGITTLGGYLGYLIATAIVAFVIWLVGYIALKYICLGLKKLLCWIAGLPVLKSIDKIIGAVFSVAVGYIIVFGVIYSTFAIVCAKFFPDLGTQVVALVENSTLFSYVHHTNFIGDFLCGMFQVDYATFAPIA